MVNQICIVFIVWTVDGLRRLKKQPQGEAAIGGSPKDERLSWPPQSPQDAI